MIIDRYDRQTVCALENKRGPRLPRVLQLIINCCVLCSLHFRSFTIIASCSATKRSHAASSWEHNFFPPAGSHQPPPHHSTIFRCSSADYHGRHRRRAGDGRLSHRPVHQETRPSAVRRATITTARIASEPHYTAECTGECLSVLRAFAIQY